MLTHWIADLADVDLFVDKTSATIRNCLHKPIDSRKRTLFSLLYESTGSTPVSELAASVGCSDRQINSYFRQQYGLSLKTHGSILRFRASFAQLRKGKLFPESDFADQAHFIREIRRFSGTIPKELYRNKNDRFIQLSVLPPA